jgi:hypothetical protein
MKLSPRATTAVRENAWTFIGAILYVALIAGTTIYALSALIANILLALAL